MIAPRLNWGLGLLLFTAALTAWSASRHSPTELEVHQLPAGLCHLVLGNFDLCVVNPPLIRSVAALPVWLAGAVTQWNCHRAEPRSRAERAVGVEFIKANGARSIWLFTLARWACIPFVVLGAWVCAVWARELYGGAAGVMAAALWCSSPYVLGHGSLMTTDAHAAAMGAFATYTFWRWLQEPTPTWMACAGVALGLAELTKFTLIVLYPVLLVAWAMYRFRSSARRTWRPSCGLFTEPQQPTQATITLTGGVSEVTAPTRSASEATSTRDLACAAGWCGSPIARRTPRLLALLAVGVLSLFVINLGYGFDGSFSRLGDFKFQSGALSGTAPRLFGPGALGNRFAGTPLAGLPVPLPKSYVLGLDVQKSDFERPGGSYLRGEWKGRGWWYFYLYALAVKTPLGSLVLLALTMILTAFSKAYSANWRDEFAVILPPVAILALVSSQTAFSIHSRYILPALPFIFVWISKTARSFELKHRAVAAITGIALCWSVVSSLAQYPHSLSYFNELGSGPRGGPDHLIGSNVDWGQDLLYLKDWIERHPEAEPLGLAFYGGYDPAALGLRFSLPPPGWRDSQRSAISPPGPTGPRPGWYALSVSVPRGLPCVLYDGDGKRYLSIYCRYDYFLRFKPVAWAGQSIAIYHITLGEANRARREMGLGELPEDPQAAQHALWRTGEKNLPVTRSEFSRIPLPNSAGGRLFPTARLLGDAP